MASGPPLNTMSLRSHQKAESVVIDAQVAEKLEVSSELGGGCSHQQGEPRQFGRLYGFWRGWQSFLGRRSD